MDLTRSLCTSEESAFSWSLIGWRECELSRTLFVSKPQRMQKRSVSLSQRAIESYGMLKRASLWVLNVRCKKVQNEIRNKIDRALSGMQWSEFNRSPHAARRRSGDRRGWLLVPFEGCTVTLAWRSGPFKGTEQGVVQTLFSRTPSIEAERHWHLDDCCCFCARGRTHTIWVFCETREKEKEKKNCTSAHGALLNSKRSCFVKCQGTTMIK